MSQRICKSRALNEESRSRSLRIKGLKSQEESNNQRFNESIRESVILTLSGQILGKIIWWVNICLEQNTKVEKGTRITPAALSAFQCLRVKVGEWEDDFFGCLAVPVQRVALAQHQNGLVLLRECCLAVNTPQHPGLIRILIPDDWQAQVGHALCLYVHLEQTWSKSKDGNLCYCWTFNLKFLSNTARGGNSEKTEIILLHFAFCIVRLLYLETHIRTSRLWWKSLGFFFTSPERSGRCTRTHSTAAPSRSRCAGAGSCRLLPRTCRGSHSLSRLGRERLCFCLRPGRCPQTTDLDCQKTPEGSPRYTQWWKVHTGYQQTRMLVPFGPSVVCMYICKIYFVCVCVTRNCMYTKRTVFICPSVFLLTLPYRNIL